jgi:hypothetical protein
VQSAIVRKTAAFVALFAGIAIAMLPGEAAGQNLLELLFGGGARQPQQQPQQPTPQRAAPSGNPIADFFADPFGLNQQQQGAPRQTSLGGGPAFCVRGCDGKYFPLTRHAASPVQMCQAFCPMAATKVYFGSTIENATSASGERYSESANAFEFRKTLRPDCSCTGRGAGGLAAVDLSLDQSLRPGDVVATGSRLLAYTGRGGTADFTPVATYPGLTSEVRSRLGEMKVTPNAAENTDLPSAPAVAPPPPQATPAPRGKRAAMLTGSD